MDQLPTYETSRTVFPQDSSGGFIGITMNHQNTSPQPREPHLKYAPIPDPLWTPAREAAFFLSLPVGQGRIPVRMSPEKGMLLREFARNTLHAKRVSDKYLATLGSILSSFATADRDGTEVLVPQRSEQHGEPRTIRTIQAQMVSAGLLDREVRTQGYGFIGAVFVYSARPPFRFQKATTEALEETYRVTEGECPYPAEQLPVNLMPEDIPY